MQQPWRNCYFRVKGNSTIEFWMVEANTKELWKANINDGNLHLFPWLWLGSAWANLGLEWTTLHVGVVSNELYQFFKAKFIEI